MGHRIEVALKRGNRDALGSRISARIASDLGLDVERVRTIDIYNVDADLDSADLELLACELADPIIQETAVDQPLARGFDWLVEIGFRPGVTDNVGRTATEIARLVLRDKMPAGNKVYTSRQYLIKGELVRSEAEKIATELLGNTLINRHIIVDHQTFERDGGIPVDIPKVAVTSEPHVELIDLDLSDEGLMNLSRERTLALSLEEMKTIRDYYTKEETIAERRERGLSEKPTDVEVEVLAQTWSEHCKHKIFNAQIDYDCDGERQQINSLFKTYIQGATKAVRSALGANDFCRSVFVDNAGVWRFDDEWNLVFKVETHNSPSALDPYGGALTGIVGVNRDTMGTGQGARMFCNTNVFCLASPFHDGEIPERLHHPHRVMEGVREGVEHGGNKSGIPTVNGSLVFDERFLGKPLVFCGTGGIQPAEINDKPGWEKEAEPGDRVIMIGGRIGKDGIHGATFSSEELHEGSPATAVQIGDPITQKRMGDFLMRARDEGLMSCLTDNGAGGLSSSVGETAEAPGGAKIDLAKAPLKYQGLMPWEIFVSEAQERMTAAVPPDKVDRFISMAEEMGVEASDLGEYTSGPNLEIWHGETLGGLFNMDFLHNGLPQMQVKAKWVTQSESNGLVPLPEDQGALLGRMLSRLDICSKEYWVRQYDHEVQGGSVIKPLSGADNDGPSDAGVVRPILESKRGVAVGHGICPKFSDVDAYHMAACATDEAMRNIVAVGANPDLVAALDNFCWCDPVESDNNPDGQFKMAQLVRANQGLFDVCVAYGMPLVSGKDSMKNDYSIGGTKISIPPTLLVTAIGQLEDSSSAVSMEVKRPGDILYVIGTTYNDLGGSQYCDEIGVAGGSVPKIRDIESAIKSYRWLHRAMLAGLISSCHDVSDGGLAVALAETSFAGGFGLNVDLADLSTDGIDRDDQALYSESPCRFVVTVRAESSRAFEIMMGDMVCKVGYVTEEQRLLISGLNGDNIIDGGLNEFKDAWKRPLLFEEEVAQ